MKKLSNYLARFSFQFLISILALQVGYAQDVDLYMQKLLAKKDFKHAIVSAYAQEVNNENVVLGHNGDMSLVPASTLKLITTLSSIDLLGEDYQYITRLTHDGVLGTDGTLNGNIYIEGSGDPLLGSTKVSGSTSFQALLRQIVEAIQGYGINCIAGEIIADESIFNSFPVCPTWQWNDLGNYYASGAWGLNIHDNQYFIYYNQAAQEGQVPKLMRYGPEIPGLELQNEVTTGKKGSGDEAYIFGGPYDYTKRIVGTIPPGNKTFTIKGSIPDPPLFLSYYVYTYLEKVNIQVESYSCTHEPSKNKEKRKLIHEFRSVTLSETVKHANFTSNNLVCEAILKTIGHVKNKDGSGSYGVRAVRQYCGKLGLDMEAMYMEDGSGLSFRNRMSTKFLSDFLKAVSLKNGLQKMTKYIPKVGMQGTVRSMLSGKSSRGYIYAKSGSMNGVICYAGYLKSKKGKWISFAIMINGFQKKYKEVKPHLEEFLHELYLNS